MVPAADCWNGPVLEAEDLELVVAGRQGGWGGDHVAEDVAGRVGCPVHAEIRAESVVGVQTEGVRPDSLVGHHEGNPDVEGEVAGRPASADGLVRQGSSRGDLSVATPLSSAGDRQRKARQSQLDHALVMPD